jgi:hypothetical protein
VRQCVVPLQRRHVSAAHLEQTALTKHTLKHDGAVGLSVERKRLEEEDTVQTRTDHRQAGGSGPRSASRLEVGSAGENDTSLHDVLTDESVQAARGRGAEDGEAIGLWNALLEQGVRWVGPGDAAAVE